MLLCVDIGNSHTSLGVYDGDTLVKTLSLSSRPERTADEYGALLLQLVGDALQDADVIVASVVPVIEGELFRAFERYAHTRPQRVTASHFPYIENQLERPHEVGVDRLLNAYAGRELYGRPLIIIDLGTAVTYDVVSNQGAYIGGAIAPGLELASHALSSGTARLPRVRIEKPPMALGRNTVTAMESGLYYGLVGAVREVVQRIGRELDMPCTIVATGGYAQLLAEECDMIEHVAPHLTLEGLRLVAQQTTA